MRLSLSQAELHSWYSPAWRMKASRSSLRALTPPARTISVRQVTSGSRLTSVAARSHDSSAARNHSSSAIRTAISGRPARNGSRVAPLNSSRIISAVRYMTCSDRMWPASCPSTVRSSRSSNRSTQRELSTTIGVPAPTAAAFANGNCVR